jgi:ubiquinone/menaquinone biosynthesis C-methylase UbiE
MNSFSSRELVRILKKNKSKGTSLDKLKIYYRPYICPFSELLTYAQEKDIILDIGCGNGQFIYLLAEIVRPQRIIGVDISDKALSQAKEYLSIIDTPYSLLKYDGLNFPEIFKKVSLIYLTDVLHHISYLDQKEFLSQIFCKMERGSRLIIKDINASSWLVHANKLHDRILNGEKSNEISLAELLEYLRTVGFYVENFYRIRLLWYPHYIVVADKL